MTVLAVPKGVIVTTGLCIQISFTLSYSCPQHEGGGGTELTERSAKNVQGNCHPSIELLWRVSLGQRACLLGNVGMIHLIPYREIHRDEVWQWTAHEMAGISNKPIKDWLYCSLHASIMLRVIAHANVFVTMPPLSWQCTSSVITLWEHPIALFWQHIPPPIYSRHVSSVHLVEPSTEMRLSNSRENGSLWAVK